MRASQGFGSQKASGRALPYLENRSESSLSASWIERGPPTR